MSRHVEAMSSTSAPSATSGSMSPIEIVLLSLLAAALSLAIALWAGVVGAAAISGGGLVAVGLGDALRAIPGLVRNPGEPSQAWPPEVADRVPGPVVYWTVTVLFVVAVVGLFVAARMLWKASTVGRRRLGVDAHARFAKRRELRPLLIREPVPGRFVLGVWGRWLIATENRRWAPPTHTGVRRLLARATGEMRSGQQGDVTSIAIAGPTRCGKTSQCAIPGLLDWAGPAIVLSVKRDLMDATIKRRRDVGEVRVFDPGGFLQANQGAIAVEDHEIARWSPLRMAHTATGAKKAGEALSSWTPKAGVDGGMDFWTTQGKLLFTGLLGAAALSGSPSMKEVAKWVYDMERPDPKNKKKACAPRDVLDRAFKDPRKKPAADSAIRHLRSIWNKPDDRIIASVYATAQTVCDPWLDPNVAAATDLKNGEGEWVDLDWLMDTGDDGKDANTLYLLVSLDDYKRLAPVLAGLLSDLKSQAYEWDMQGRAFPAPLLMLIDEAGNIPLSWLPEVSSTCAGIGIQLVTIWQSLAQIHEAYGKRADILLTNHATKLFFPGASDDSTLGYVSKIVGDEDVERRSWSNDLGGGRRSISGQQNREPLVPYFLSRLPRYGSALLIHSNIPPAHVQGREWWRIKRLAEMAPPQSLEPTVPAGCGPWTPTPSRPGRRQGVATHGDEVEARKERCEVEAVAS